MDEDEINLADSAWWFVKRDDRYLLSFAGCTDDFKTASDEIDFLTLIEDFALAHTEPEHGDHLLGLSKSLKAAAKVLDDYVGRLQNA
jgi:hypothetical protein